MTRLEAFLGALPHAHDDEFVNAPGLGTFKAKFIRRGLERGVIVEHSSGMGLCLVEPSEHGSCGFCKGRKGTQPCEHCACKMCVWFRQTDELASPRVSHDKLQQLVRRMKAFRFGAAIPAGEPALDGEV